MRFPVILVALAFMPIGCTKPEAIHPEKKRTAVLNAGSGLALAEESASELDQVLSAYVTALTSNQESTSAIPRPETIYRQFILMRLPESDRRRSFEELFYAISRFIVYVVEDVSQEYPGDFNARLGRVSAVPFNLEFGKFPQSTLQLWTSEVVKRAWLQDNQVKPFLSHFLRDFPEDYADFLPRLMVNAMMEAGIDRELVLNELAGHFGDQSDPLVTQSINTMADMIQEQGMAVGRVDRLLQSIESSVNESRVQDQLLAAINRIRRLAGREIYTPTSDSNGTTSSKSNNSSQTSSSAVRIADDKLTDQSAQINVVQPVVNTSSTRADTSSKTNTNTHSKSSAIVSETSSKTVPQVVVRKVSTSTSVSSKAGSTVSSSGSSGGFGVIVPPSPAVATTSAPSISSPAAPASISRNAASTGTGEGRALSTRDNSTPTSQSSQSSSDSQNGLRVDVSDSSLSVQNSRSTERTRTSCDPLSDAACVTTTQQTQRDTSVQASRDGVEARDSSERSNSACVAGTPGCITNTQNTTREVAVRTRQNGVEASGVNERSRSTCIAGTPGCVSTTRRTEGSASAEVSGGQLRAEGQATRSETRCVGSACQERSRTVAGSGSVGESGVDAQGSVTRSRGGSIAGQGATQENTRSAGGQVGSQGNNAAASGEVGEQRSVCVTGSVNTCGTFARNATASAQVGPDGVRASSTAGAGVDVAGVPANVQASRNFSIGSDGSIAFSDQMEANIGPVRVVTPRLGVEISPSGVRSTVNPINIVSTARIAADQVNNVIRSSANTLSGWGNAMGGAFRSAGNAIAGVFGGGRRNPPYMGQLQRANPPTAAQLNSFDWWDHIFYHRMGAHRNHADNSPAVSHGFWGGCPCFFPRMAGRVPGDNDNIFLMVNRSWLTPGSPLGDPDVANSQCCYPRFKQNLNFADDSYLAPGGKTWVRGYDVAGTVVYDKCVDNIGDCCQACQRRYPTNGVHRPRMSSRFPHCAGVRYIENDSHCTSFAANAGRGQRDGRMSFSNPRMGKCTIYSSIDHIATRNQNYFVAFPVVDLEDTAQRAANPALRGTPKIPSPNLRIAQTVGCPVPDPAPFRLERVDGQWCTYNGIRARGRVLSSQPTHLNLNSAQQACGSNRQCAGVDKHRFNHYGTAMILENGRRLRIPVTGTVDVLRFPDRPLPRVQVVNGQMMLLISRNGREHRAWTGRGPTLPQGGVSAVRNFWLELNNRGTLEMRMETNQGRPLYMGENLWDSPTPRPGANSTFLALSLGGELCLWQARPQLTARWCAGQTGNGAPAAALVPTITQYRLLSTDGIGYQNVEGTYFWGKKLPGPSLVDRALQYLRRVFGFR